jgi:hypothetical protein
VLEGVGVGEGDTAAVHEVTVVSEVLVTQPTVPETVGFSPDPASHPGVVKSVCRTFPLGESYEYLRPLFAYVIQVSRGDSIIDAGGTDEYPEQGIVLAYDVLTNEKLETENVPYSQVKLTLLVADAVEQPKAILVIGVDSNGEPEQEGE